MPKLGSKKSRGGCTNCKRRRVKCDENKPCCASCAKYHMACVYVTGSSVSSTHENEYGAPSQRGRRRSAARRSRDGADAHGPGRPGNHQSSNSLSVLADAVSSVEASQQPRAPTQPVEPNVFHTSCVPPTPFAFTLLDLELLHNFTIATYSTIARESTFDVWRIHVPRMAATRDWLMRGVIALSALHEAADYSPDQHRTLELVQIALTSMNAGLPNLNNLVSTISLDDTESCGAIAAYSSIVTIYALALPSVQYFTSVRLGSQNPDLPPEDPLGQLMHTFDLIRGTAEVYRKIWTALQEGPMAPVTRVDIFDDLVPIPPDSPLVLNPTEQALRKDDKQDGDSWSGPRRQLLDKIHVLGQNMEKHLPTDERKTCVPTYRKLYLVARRLGGPGFEIPLAWPAIITQPFMRLLREYHPPALSLLAVWALMLSDLRWLTRGWKQWILEALHLARQRRQDAAGEVANVFWDTVHWAHDIMQRHPEFGDVLKSEPVPESMNDVNAYPLVTTSRS